MNASPPSPIFARYAEQAFLLALGGGILGAAAAISAQAAGLLFILAWGHTVFL